MCPRAAQGGVWGAWFCPMPSGPPGREEGPAQGQCHQAPWAFLLYLEAWNSFGSSGLSARRAGLQG